ncbi:hypothetical protein LSAT2_012439 [Lamellibrachia satsuma]|nr:hypothetical protein LSAT2_012439 [Lamellibrachia satsuma]
MQVYNKSKWKGGVLQLQFAKENFLDRLKKEQIEAKEEKCVQKPTLGTEAAPVAVMTIPKRATPGTVVGEEKVRLNYI